VNLGFEIGIKEVSVTRMYKFERRKKSRSCEVVEHPTPHQAAADEDGHFPTDMREVLREIRRTLREAWQQLATPSERRRVFKRLLLRWHPDKNPGNEDFCNEVTKKILEYYDILEDGGSLPENDDEVDRAPYRPRSDFASNFFFNMNARAHSYRAAYDDYESFSSRPCPHPGQAKRWMRQAQADLDAARAARGTSDRGRNWICYMCHQVKSYYKSSSFFKLKQVLEKVFHV
jgi:sacsin